MLCFFPQTFVEGHRFFEQYEMIFAALKEVADVYVKSDSSSKNIYIHSFVYVLTMFLLKVFWAIDIIIIINIMLQGLKPVTGVSPKTALAILKTLLPVSQSDPHFFFSIIPITFRT